MITKKNLFVGTDCRYCHIVAVGAVAVAPAVAAVVAGAAVIVAFAAVVALGDNILHVAVMLMMVAAAVVIC